MRSRGVALIAFSLGALLLAVPVGQAQDGEDPTEGPRWLDIRYDVELSENLTELKLAGTVGLHEAESTDQTRGDCQESCSADELRDLYDRLGPRGKTRLVEGIEDKIAQTTEDRLSAIAQGGEASAEADLDEDSIAMSSGGHAFLPAIPVQVTGSAVMGTPGDRDYTDAQIDALFRMGARAPFQTTVDPWTNLTLTLSVPSPLKVLGSGEGPTDEAELVQANWKGSSPVELAEGVSIGRSDVVVPSRERIDLEIVLDLSNVDVHYLSTLTGGTPASLDAALSVDGSIRSIETPRDIQRFELPYLSADAVRIGIENDLVDVEQITSFEDEARSSIRSAFQGSFGVTVPVSGGFQTDTLGPEAIGTPAGTGGPIRLLMSAEAEIPIPPENGTAGAAGFEVTRFSVGTIELPAIPTPGGHPANVTMILPEGVGLAFEDVTGSDVTRSETEDGRTAITFTTTGDGQGATIQGAELVVQHPVVWNLLWPLIIFLIVVLVGIPALIIVYVVRERRKRRGVNQERRSPVRGGYADQKDQRAASGGQGSEGPGGDDQTGPQAGD